MWRNWGWFGICFIMLAVSSWAQHPAPALTPLIEQPAVSKFSATPTSGTTLKASPVKPSPTPARTAAPTSRTLPRAPQRTVAPQTVPQTMPQGPMVYMTPKGECYHRPDCQYARGGTPVTLQQATQAGRRPCSICLKPRRRP